MTKLNNRKLKQFQNFFKASANTEAKQDSLKLTKISVIANNALYFNDSSDYKTALRDILKLTSPKLYGSDGYLISKLEFKEED